MKFTKEDARRRVLNCAKQYQQKLLNKKLIIIYRDRQDNAIRYIEVVFHERNYQHLTGLELVDKEGNVLRNQSMNFYRKCIENKLGLEEFRFTSRRATSSSFWMPRRFSLWPRTDASSWTAQRPIRSCGSVR